MALYKHAMEPATDIEFVEDVPPRQGGPGSGTKFSTIADTLRAQPGEWAIVRRATTPNGSFFSHAKHRLESLGCEAATRRVDDELRLYARWPEACAS